MQSTSNHRHLARVIIAILFWVLLLAAAREPVSTSAVGPLFAVIPTIGIGGPLAILALLFPGLFGGGLLLFRQWTAFFAVFSFNSLLLLLHWCYAIHLAGSWFGSQTALWVTLTLATLLGVIWAWRRHLPPVTAEAPRMRYAPPRTEYMVLLILSICCLGLVVFYWFFPPMVLSPMWMLTFTLSIGIWVGTIYKLVAALRDRISARPAPHLPTEGVMLWAMLAPSLVILSSLAMPGGVTSEVAVSSEGMPAAEFEFLQPLENPWLNNYAGMILSSPKVKGDRLYVSVAHNSGIATMGAVYCLDRHTAKVIWTFDDDGQMKQIFSSPCLANGRLYIGEGFHYDPNCKLYSIDATTGKKVWEFQTTSQTEGTPNVAGDTVYFSAGNDGVYAADANTGKKIWRYGQALGELPLWRVGTSPRVAGNRLFVGSGVDRDQRQNCETSIVCLDAKTGKESWKVKTNLPCWSDAVIAGDRAFFGLGNGDLFTDDPVRPAGMMLCLALADGKEIWRYEVGNGIHGEPSVDARHVYFGSRDGYCYCVGRFDGKLRWRADLGSPILGRTILDQGDLTGRAVNVFAQSMNGRVSCLDAGNGKAHWSNSNLEGFAANLVGTPALVATPTAEGTRRQLYVTASLFSLSVPKVHCFQDLLPAAK